MNKPGPGRHRMRRQYRERDSWSQGSSQRGACFYVGRDSLLGIIVVRVKLDIWNPRGRVPGTRQVQNVAVAIQGQGVFSAGLEGQGWAVSGPSGGQPECGAAGSGTGQPGKGLRCKGSTSRLKVQG